MMKQALDYLDALRPCKQAVHAIDANVAVTRELNASITKLNETLSDYRVPQRRSGDVPPPTNWPRRPPD